ncbi:MAG: DUF3419 family protein [Alphaproteobacteria bacterium]
MNGRSANSREAIGGAPDLIRYAQCWEDADVLLEGLDCRPGDSCLSIASAGDNAIALLTRDPARVICVDFSAAQLACVELRMAAYRTLDHEAFLELYGARVSRRRGRLYEACVSRLSSAARPFWEQKRAHVIRHGFAGIGRFESYFRRFREWVLPLTQSRRTVRGMLLEPKSPAARRSFYEQEWNNWRWRTIFRFFSSRPILSALGREPAFFNHVQGSLAAHMNERIAHAVVTLDPGRNPYLHWILNGHFGDTLPVALRAEHFETIRDRLDRLELRRSSLNGEARRLHSLGERIDRFNLSDVFEYMSLEESNDLLSALAGIGASGGRLLYWNMMVPRSRPPALAGRLRPLDGLAQRLHLSDRAFFYRRLVIEEII